IFGKATPELEELLSAHVLVDFAEDVGQNPRPPEKRRYHSFSPGAWQRADSRPGSAPRGAGSLTPPLDRAADARHLFGRAASGFGDLLHRLEQLPPLDLGAARTGIVDPPAILQLEGG